MSRSTSASTITGALSLEDRLVGFFDMHYARMTRLAGLVSHDASTAEDVVQAAMEQAWRHRRKLRDPDRLRWWIDRIVVREAIRMNRRVPKHQAVVQLTEAHARVLEDPRVRVGPARLLLDAAFATLAAEQRVAIVLHLHIGYSVPDTARLMGTSVETTRSRLRLARQRLRSHLEEEESS